MRGALVLLTAVLCVRADTPRYELRGRLLPATRASVWLHGATAPFEDVTLSDDEGHFRFRGLLAGAYTLGAFVPGRGEIRRTIEVGPSQAGARKRIELTVELRDGEFESRDSLRRGAIVSARELAIPQQAHRAYDEAEKRLARRDVEGAVAHFERAVELAPRFSEAWNHLGTIAYQAREYTRAESCFRKGLDADPNAFQPLVNLGGVSLNLGKFEEALQYNLYAALSRPGDALANSQLGMNYFYLGKVDLAQKYLTIAKRLDPAHFSHPQLMLAEIALRRQDRIAAAGELEEFLQYHPDAPEAGKVKVQVAQLRAPSDPALTFAATGMARTFSEAPELQPLDGDPYSILRKDGRYDLQDRDRDGQVRRRGIDAAIGSGRHARILLSRTADGGWTELPLAWYAENGGRYAASPAFGFSANCLACHARQKDGRPAAFACASCHGVAGSGKPGQQVCLQCHPETSGPNSAHGTEAHSEDRFDFNSAGYRLLESKCYRASAGKLTCTTCHPPHSFSKTPAELRLVCRGCHPAMHNGAPLDCTRCHMPQRQAQDAPGIMVTDHRIQRPL
ncbi:MAG: tetratricopeptide repeat protein [Bryobacteraceae bacterium]|jgi:tetratricopeptide (TPR) repeat protein